MSVIVTPVAAAVVLSASLAGSVTVLLVPSVAAPVASPVCLDAAVVLPIPSYIAPNIVSKTSFVAFDAPNVWLLKSLRLIVGIKK